MDWIDTWEDPFDLLFEIDTLILGGGMYPGYEHYWRTIFANPESVSPFTGIEGGAGSPDLRHTTLIPAHVQAGATASVPHRMVTGSRAPARTSHRSRKLWDATRPTRRPDSRSDVSRYHGTSISRYRECEWRSCDRLQTAHFWIGFQQGRNLLAKAGFLGLLRFSSY